ncbi:lipoteichoic acid synthase 2 [Clostridium puniceum]|uniref:Lipoteichoic acid synthase 2 n=1 Tax=Clostridium puniceum TaxID=29367 RepID=A0A1S8TPS1_9CLOT|nr:LTA synthase family protein [Clostridium puniceum]OOM79753.1 lipoteichoic acid synthase 2 [Clostridium puniceum]
MKFLTLFFTKFMNCIMKFSNKFLDSSIAKLRFFTIFDMLIKNILFMTIIHMYSSNFGTSFTKALSFSIVYLGFVLLLYSFGYMFSNKKQVLFYIILNILFTILIISDLWYFRANRDFLGLQNIFIRRTFNPSGLSLINPEIIDLVFFMDIVPTTILFISKKISNTQKRNLPKFTISLTTSLVIIISSILFIDIFKLSNYSTASISKPQWNPAETVAASGPISYHLQEASKTITRLVSNPSSDDINEIETWINNNKENLPDNEFKGLFKGKNVIFLQIESLENFVIGKSTNGKEIAPFLTKLSKEGLYFTNIYEQNNGGDSIDCDFLINSSTFTLGDQITALNYSENTYPNSLPKLFENIGYNTITSHAENYSAFNWSKLHKNAFGVETLWSLNEYNYDEAVGYGISDRTFLNQLSEKLKTVKQPFLFQSPTLSSHGPFNIGKQYRQLDLPKEIDESKLGGYFESIHYTDEQIKMFFDKLSESGILNNTVVVMYGDHTGVHKYYNNEIKDLDYEGNWWKDYDHKIPLIIYTPNMNPSIITASGGQSDFLPTISYLMGMDKSLYENTSMGRVLVNTNRNSTIIRTKEIEGKVKSPEEEQHVLNSYIIGEKIIKTNFFAKYKPN